MSDAMLIDHKSIQPKTNTMYMIQFSLRQNLRTSFAAIALLLLLTQAGFAQIVPNANGVVFVNTNISGGNSSGNSWANAVPQLADALVAAHGNTAIHQIWVAKGTYAPMYSAGSDGMNPYLQFGVPGASFNSFLLVNNVKLYGGFQNANETSISQRDTINNNTILSGPGSNHVVMSVGNAGTAEINGFTISDGHGVAMQNLTVNAMITYSARGGGIYLESSSPVISNCVITGNHTEWGGGIYANNSSLNISNTTITNNYATGGPGNVTNSNPMAFGGGIYVRGGNSVSINNCNISKNTVSAAMIGVTGGGICISGYSCTATISNSTISNNTISAVISSSSYNANGSATGGGIFLVTAATTISNCTISDNSVTVSTANAAATGLNYTYAGGSGILNGSPLVINNSTISNNELSATVNPANNSSGWCSGAGIMNDGGLIPGNGGGMVTGSNSVINNCIIEGNSATGNFNPSGGGIAYNTPFLLVTPVIPKISNSVIRNNTSGKYGGGLYCYALSPLIKNTLIENNTAADGGAICNVSGGQAARPLLANCTVYGNAATAANANVITNNDSCSTSIHNGILYGNNGNVTGQGTTITYSIVQGSTVYPGTGNSNANPMFSNAAGGDFALQGSSPAVNKGSNTAYSIAGNINTDTDLATNPRLYGSNIDMGAFELQKDPDVSPSAISAVHTDVQHMIAYPNPVRAGQALTLRCDYSPAELAGAHLKVTDIAGRVRQTRTSVQPVQTLMMHAAGTYFITLTFRDGKQATVSVVVK